MAPVRHAAFARRFRDARQLAALPEADVASLLAVSVTTVGRWARGETTPESVVRRDLAKLLHVPFHVLFPPEEAADALSPGQASLLLTAHHLVRQGAALYINVTRSDRHTVRTLQRLWLVEDAGPDRLGGRLYRLTGPGEDAFAAINDGKP